MITPPSYRYSHTVGYFSVPMGQGFNNPVDIALASDGTIYVLSRAGSSPFKRVTMCTVDEEFLGEFGGCVGEGKMVWPVGLALSEDGKVYVSDEALNRVSVFSSQGEYLDHWGAHGSGDGEFDRPGGVAFDGEGNLLVADGLNHRIQRYTRDGGFLESWGKPGRGDGEFNNPWGIGVDSRGCVYVADWRNDRIQKFDQDGRHLATWGTSGHEAGHFHRPAGVCVDDEDYVYVADWGNERVQVLAPDGSFVAKFRGESGMSRWAYDFMSRVRDELELRAKADMEPHPYDGPYHSPRSESSSIEKLFWGPTSVKVDGQGRVYVADSCRHRIQVYVKEDASAALPAAE